MSRVLPLAIVSIASVVAIVASALAMDWFVATLSGAFAGLDLRNISIDLREARACAHIDGTLQCGSAPMDLMDSGLYGPLSTITFWGAMLFALAVVYQCGSKLFAGVANETITNAAHGLASLVMLATVGAGYLFGPDVGDVEVIGVGITVERTWAPVAMLVGVIAGNIALYMTRESEVAEYKPVEVPIAVARTRTATKPPAVAPQPPTQPMPRIATERPKIASGEQPPLVARTRTPTTPPPIGLTGKVQYATIAGEVTIAGIDARREDRAGVLVLWRDVVGLVVRRLPDELEGHTFLDIVSTAGMTLRILPWTKLTGELVDGADHEARLRTLVALVRPRCNDAKVDKATQLFLDGKPAAQLGLDVLPKHDHALA